VTGSCEHCNELTGFHKKLKKSKVVPLHAMKAPGGKGGKAPTHS
jgi:hypothetical protein